MKKTNKKYYLPADNDTYDSVYGGDEVCCLSYRGCIELINAWQTDGYNDGKRVKFHDFWREASTEEIAEYGTYDVHYNN